MKPRLRKISLGLSALSWLLIFCAYWIQPDSLTGLTNVPAWWWLFPGFGFALLGWRKGRRRITVLLLALWLIFLICFVGEARSIFHRGPWPDPAWVKAKAEGRALRVISFNSDFSPAALREVEYYQPDIILFQEGHDHTVADFAKDFYGATAQIVRSKDAFILTRGALLPSPRSSQDSITQAYVLLNSGLQAQVISLHLYSPKNRRDFWRLGFWQAQAEARRIHWEQIDEVVSRLATLPPTTPVIVGGDFNSPAGDAIFRAFRGRLRDSFKEGGRGWGDTFSNHKPLFRIDQIWISPQWQAVSVVARKVKYSDHRMVVADLILKP
jgi:endonuclease/exonuclease/phosphatase (EEP) superfamily protein YafD